MKIKNILFPVDFSERCRLSAPAVKAFAQRYGARITLVHVFSHGPETAFPMGLSDVLIGVDIESTRKFYRTRLDFFLRDEFKDMAVDRVLLEGDTARILCSFAEESGADLIMMPTHGYGSFRRLLLGSVAAKVLHDSKIPVWTDAHRPEPYQEPEAARLTFVCPVDGTEASVPLMRAAYDFAEEQGATLYFVHAIPFANATPEHFFDDNVQSAILRNARERLCKLQHIAGVDAAMCVHYGSPADITAAAATEHHASLTVMSRGHLQQRLGGLRSNAYGILRESPCPVLTL